jgi:hypothetical protein
VALTAPSLGLPGSADAQSNARASGEATAAIETSDERKRECISAHERMQRERLEGRLLAARSDALRCAEANCPAMLRDECAQWSRDLAAELPSVRFELVDGRGIALPAVWNVDARPIAPNEVAALELDPGAHTVRATASDGRAVVETFALGRGERARVVRLVLPASEEPPARLLPAPSTPSSAPASQVRTWAPPVASIVVGSVGVVGLGLFTGFGLAGRDREAALLAACAPLCARDEVGAMRRDYAIADTGLAVGLVALGVGVVLWAIDEPSATSAHAEGFAWRF